MSNDVAMSELNEHPWMLPPSVVISELESKSLAALEWPKLSESLQARCVSAMGKAYWASPHFWNDGCANAKSKWMPCGRLGIGIGGHSPVCLRCQT